MNINELLEMLDLEVGAQFEYFECMSDLVEAEDEINADVMYQLFKDIDMEIMADLLNNYFDDILEAVPEDAMEVYTLLDSVKMSMIGMAKNIGDETDTVRFAEQFAAFRNWYSIDSQVYLAEIGNYENEQCVCMRDALTMHRCEELGGEKYEYTFDEALNFEMDEYSMSFADLINEEPSYDDDFEDIGDLDVPGLEYTDRIFNPDDEEKLN